MNTLLRRLTISGLVLSPALAGMMARSLPGDLIVTQTSAAFETRRTPNATGDSRGSELIQISDPAYLLAVDTHATPWERKLAVQGIKNQFLLSSIAKDAVGPRIAHEALRRLTLPSLLYDTSTAAAYSSVRRLAEARRKQQWRTDLEAGAWTCSKSLSSRSGTYDCKLSIRNASRDLSHGNLYFVPASWKLTDEGGFSLEAGDIGPASVREITQHVQGDKHAKIAYEGAPVLTHADTYVKVDESEGVVAGWKAPTLTRLQVESITPEISDVAVVQSIVRSSVVGDISSVTTRIIVTAADPNFDRLSYTWSASNGSIQENGLSVVYWDRPLDEKGRAVQAGAITVVASNSKGARAEKTFRLDVPEDSPRVPTAAAVPAPPVIPSVPFVAPVPPPPLLPSVASVPPVPPMPTPPVLPSVPSVPAVPPLLPAGVSPTAGVAGHTYTKQEMQREYVRYLAAERYDATVTAEGNVRFRRGGQSYLIVVDERDPTYFEVMTWIRVEDKSPQARFRHLEGTNSVVAETKVAKAYVDHEGDVIIAAEMYIGTPEDVKRFLPRILRAFDIALEKYKMKAGGGH